MKLNKLLTFILEFGLMLTCVTINTYAEDNVDYLDLETTDTYKDSKDLDQNYTFTQSGDTTYTDETKVKLNWTINDINATYNSNKTWDPEKLEWTEAKKDINVTHNGASFTLTNYSSKKVIGTVSFDVESTLKDTFTSVTFDDNNGKEIDTVVNTDYTIDETKKTNVPSNTITATLAFNNDKFADVSATSSATKYGTYTVTISEVPKVTWKSLSAMVQGSTVNYLPVFADNSAPENITFAYKDGDAYTTIENPTMTSLASYANAGTLYYSGSGTLVTVRSVNDMDWADIFYNPDESYPYYASTAYGDLEDGIREKIASDGSEIVEKLVMETSGYPSQMPTINGVIIDDIYAVYTNESSDGFGSDDGCFWSCVASDWGEAFVYSMNGTSWNRANLGSSYCLLISRTFN